MDKIFKVFNYHKAKEKPVIVEKTVRNKDFVFYDSDNLFPQRLNKLADNSSIHSAIIFQKAKFIAGEGLIFKGSQAERAEALFSEWMKWDIESFLTMTATDLAINDGYSWEAIYQRDGQINKLLHKDFSRIRSGKMVDGHVDEYFFSSDWTIATSKANPTGESERHKPVMLPSFNFEEGRMDGKQCLYVFGYKQGKDFYPEPDYLGALNYIDIAGRISEFHKNNLENGFSGSVHIHAFGNFDEDDQDDLRQLIEEEFTGSENAGRVVVTTGTQEEGAPIINELPSLNNSEILQTLERTTNQEILAAHRMPLSLAGLPFAQGLQSESLAVKEALDLFQNTVIAPKQRMITKKIDALLALHGIEVETKIAPLTPISFIQSDTIKMATMTVNEMRAEGGLDPVDGGDIIPDSGIQSEENE